MRKLAGIVAFTATCFTATHVIADQGVSDTEIRFAQVAAIEGPAAALGTGVQQGILAAFAEATAPVAFMAGCFHCKAWMTGTSQPFH